MTANAQEMARARFEGVVHGLVQGVFFRYATKRQADRLGLSGTVRNCTDGTVHVDASGPRKRLEELLEWLHRGPERAIVERVDVTWHDSHPARGGFRIVG